MITRFRVQNYKALRDVTLDLTPMHLLIGPNDSGKTSILEAMAALCRSVEEPLADAFVGTWHGASLVYNQDVKLAVTLAATIEDSEAIETIHYQLEVSFHPDPESRSVKEFSETLDYNEEGYVLAEHDGSNTTRLRLVSVKGMPVPDVVPKPLATDVIDALRGVQLYRFVPDHLALPAALDSRRRMRMEPSGFGLPTLLDDIRDFDPRRFDELQARFKSIFPDIAAMRPRTEIGYSARSYNNGQVLKFEQAEGKGLHFAFVGDAPDVAASQVSDGMLLVLAYLAILYLPKPPRVLLIEEPENGIHPARLQEVLTILRDLVKEQSQTQVVLTSHSPYVVSMFGPEEVTLCHKGDDGSIQVRRLSDSKAVREQVDFFTLGEIWTLEGDEALLETGLEEPSTP